MDIITPQIVDGRGVTQPSVFVDITFYFNDDRRTLALEWSPLGWVQAQSQDLRIHSGPRSIVCLVG
jgi:hypothetical protein